MLTQRDVTVTRLFPSGYYECTAIINGAMVSMTYGGFTKREALREFLYAVNRKNKKGGK